MLEVLYKNTPIPVVAPWITAHTGTCFNSVSSLIDTVMHNFDAIKGGSPLFYQRSFWNNRLDPADLDEFRKTLKKFLTTAGEKSVKVIKKYEQKTPFRNQLVAGVSLSYFEMEEEDDQAPL